MDYGGLIVMLVALGQGPAPADSFLLLDGDDFLLLDFTNFLLFMG